MTKPVRRKKRKKFRGLRVGAYRIKPLGLLALALILLLAILCVIIFVGKPMTVGGGGFLSPTATPTPTPTPTFTPTPSPTPSPTPEPTPRSATIRAIGEIAMQSNLLAAAQTGNGGYDFGPMFSEISTIMGDADFTIADVEGSLGGSAEVSGAEKMVTPPELIANLKDCGVDMLNLANDHMLDGGWNDLLAAMGNCDSAGMLYIGAAKTREERSTPKVYEINGIKVGFVAYSESVPGLKDADADAQKFGVCAASGSKPKEDVKACRDAGAEIVIACVSWGEQFQREITDKQKAAADILVQADVDVIIGYNPHVVQQALWLKKPKDAGRTLCILSCGNFLSDAREKYRDSSVIFEFTLSEDSYNGGIQVTSPKYIPTYVWRSETEDDGGNMSYDYRTLSAGQWLEAAPEGMNYTQESRLREVWAEAQGIIDAEVASVSKE